MYNEDPNVRLELEKVNCILCGESNFEVLTTGQDYEYKTSNEIFCMVKCLNCHHVYLNPRPTVNTFKIIYPNNYFSYEEVSTLSERLKKRNKNSYISYYKKLIGTEGKILEVGSGCGELLEILKQDEESNWKLYGVDIDKNANEKARKKGIKIYEGIFENISLPKNYFDLVIMNQLIEHVLNPLDVLIKTEEILKKGGYLVIETPNISSLDSKIFKEKYWGGYHFPRHMNLFTIHSFKELIVKSGLTSIKFESLRSPSVWVLSLHNMLYDRCWPDRIVRQFNRYNLFFLALFTIVDIIQLRLGLETSNMRVVAKK